MLRLRQRDHERVATFERERAALTSTLRDREAMARAGELTAGIVHEVGNSIGAIALSARVAEKSSDERVQAAGASILSEVRAIQSVMTRFVSFIRTEQVHWDRFDLERMIKRIASRESEHAGTPVEVAGTSAQVIGDEDLLERAIENVVRNACQAAGPEGRVSISFGVEHDEAIVHVADNGPGIVDPEKALRPFESGRPGGLGLGLPLVLKILSLHHGTLDLSRDLSGRGTRAVCRWSQTPPDATIGNTSTASRDPSRR
jgi:signal transduction histidine kinase